MEEFVLNILYVALLIVIVVLVLIFIIGFYFVIRVSCVLNAELKTGMQEICDHRNSQYDEGHPEYPWKCNDCGYRH